MTVRDLHALLRQDDFTPDALPRVMLWHGEEEWLKEAALRRLIERCVPEGLEAFNLSRFEENASAAEILDACGMPPIAGAARLVVVRDHAALGGGRVKEADADALTEGIAGVGAGTILLFTCHGKADARRKLVQAIGNAGTLLFERPDEIQAARWLLRRASERGAELEAEAAEAMVARAGCALSHLDGDLEKVLAHADGRAATLADVEALVPRSLESSAFELADEILARRGGRAWSLLRERLGQGDGRVAILAMLARTLRQAYEARRMLDARVREGEIASALQISVYAARHVIRRAGTRESAWWAAAVKAALEAEDAIKSGRMNEEFAFDGMMAYLLREA